MLFYLLFLFKHDLAVLDLGDNAVARLEFTFQHRARKRVLDQAHDGAAQGARAVNGVKALLCHQSGDFIVKRDRNSAIFHPFRNLCKQQGSDRADVFLCQTVENDDVVPEEAAQVQKKPTLRKPQRYCHNTGSTKEKVLEVNPYLERNMTIHKRKEAHSIF